MHVHTCTRSCKCTPQTCTHKCTHTALPAHAHTVPPLCVTHPPHRQGRKVASCTDNVTDARLSEEGGTGRVVTSHVCQAIVVPSDVVGYRAVVSSQPVSLADRVVGERIEPPFLLDPRPSPWRASGHAQHLQALLAPTGAGTPGTRDAASPCCHHRCHHEPHAGRHHRAPRALPPCQPRAARHHLLLQVGLGGGQAPRSVGGGPGALLTPHPPVPPQVQRGDAVVQRGPGHHHPPALRPAAARHRQPGCAQVGDTAGDAGGSMEGGSQP